MLCIDEPLEIKENGMKAVCKLSQKQETSNILMTSNSNNNYQIRKIEFARAEADRFRGCL